jgi:ABC-2 type transport system permease protein
LERAFSDGPFRAPTAAPGVTALPDPVDAPGVDLHRTGEQPVVRAHRSTGTLRTTEISKRPNPFTRIKHIWQYRELLGNLIRKELKVKYKNSVLGFVWSLLNPALQLVVFGVVFGVIFHSAIPQFPIFILTGLLVWNFYTAAAGAATSSITGNGQLVNKVWFPREVLPISAVGAALVHFFLQSLVLIAALLIVQDVPAWAYAPLLIPAILDLLLFTAAFGITLAAINVYLRDTQHLLELLLLAWFWGTPIVIAYNTIADKLTAHGLPSGLLLLNPITPIVITFQRVLYNQSVGVSTSKKTYALPPGSVWWYGRNLLFVGVFSFALLMFGLWLFGRLEDNFGQEI